MTRKSILTIALCLCALPPFSGCVIPDAAQIRQFADEAKRLSDRVDDYQVVVNDVKTLLVEDKIISEKAAERIDKIGEEIDRVQPNIEAIADSVKNADYVDGDDIGNIVKGLQAANAASAPVNPYAPLIDAVLGVVALAAGGFAVKKTRDAGRAELVLDKTKEGISKFEGVSDPAIASKLHDTIKAKITNI